MESSESTPDILNTVRAWQDAGKGVAMCTVVNTWGSSPRPTGSQLLVDDEGQFIGSVSGGCIEGAVIREALQVIETGTPKKLEFGVSDQEAWDVGLACGGKVEVWVEKVEA
jgi:xanthine/CO dehydrogenase XdhC/CoxF family maturation factor